MAYNFDQTSILVVDDHAPLRTLVQNILRTFGFRIILMAGSADEAFELYCRHAPDIVLTDWIIDNDDGLELTKRIRHSERSPNPYVPVILMTGFSYKERVCYARDLGVTEFLVKPFSSRDLYSRLVQIIERPRQFVKAKAYFGPDRRRSKKGEGRGKRKADKSAKENKESKATQS
ncbi:MAG: response regulator [Alphaproteobacteria bacterium]|nr:response regulator [Alphaproteobacteria bacterium]